MGYGQTTKRAGWVLRDVRNPESIADHMYRMGLMALIASDLPGVDRDKLGFLLLLLFLLYVDCFLMLHIVEVGFVCFDFIFSLIWVVSKLQVHKNGHCP